MNTSNPNMNPTPTPSASTPHSLVPHKAPKRDLRRGYRTTVEVGLVIALLVLIGVMQVPLRDRSNFDIVVAEQEVVQIDEIKQTQQEVKPPPPPKPRVLQVVSDDVILDDFELDLDASFDIEEAPEYIPPPPPPAEEVVEEEEEEEIFMVVEQMPELIGGLASLQSCIRYPEMARKAGIEGRVFVQFVVNENGTVSDPVVIRSLGGGTDEEALRCISQAKFKPGMQRNRPVRVRYSVPITFKLRSADPR